MLNVDCSILRDCMPKKKYAQEFHNLHREYNNYFIIGFRYRILISSDYQTFIYKL